MLVNKQATMIKRVLKQRAVDGCVYTSKKSDFKRDWSTRLETDACRQTRSHNPNVFETQGWRLMLVHEQRTTNQTCLNEGYRLMLVLKQSNTVQRVWDRRMSASEQMDARFEQHNTFFHANRAFVRSASKDTQDSSWSCLWVLKISSNTRVLEQSLLTMLCCVSHKTIVGNRLCDEINLANCLSQDHFLSALASLLTDNKNARLPLRAKYKHFKNDLWTNFKNNSPTDPSFSFLKRWSSKQGLWNFE